MKTISAYFLLPECNIEDAKGKMKEYFTNSYWYALLGALLFIYQQEDSSIELQQVIEKILGLEKKMFKNSEKELNVLLDTYKNYALFYPDFYKIIKSAPWPSSELFKSVVEKTCIVNIEPIEEWVICPNYSPG